MNRTARPRYSEHFGRLAVALKETAWVTVSARKLRQPYHSETHFIRVGAPRPLLPANEAANRFSLLSLTHKCMPFKFW